MTRHLGPAGWFVLVLGLMASLGAGSPRLARVRALGLPPPQHRADHHHALPPIVFVSRHPIPGASGTIPGLGPHHRAAVTGGRLMVLETDGRIHDLLPRATLYDVSDPAVSLDGRWLAFAGVTHPDSAWRIYVARSDGSDLRPVTRSDRVLDLAALGPGARRFSRYDDIDPCWISDSVLCFASTRLPEIAEYADVPVTNLYRIDWHGRHLSRLTSERNGAEEPIYDRRNGHIIYARWWFNRYRASAMDPTGITTERSRALARDSVNVWQAIELGPRDGTFHLAGGAIRSRRGTMAYQPALLADGTLIGVYAQNLGLSPGPGATGIQAFPGRYGVSRRLAGAIVGEQANDSYSRARGLAAPSACSPAALPDGRIVFAYDPGARGDFGIYVMNADGSGIERVADLRGTLELDPAPVVAWPPYTGPAPSVVDRRARPGPLGEGTEEETGDRRATSADPTFVFFCRNVFAGGPVDSPVGDAPAVARHLLLRFFAALPRFDRAGGDTAILVREVPVGVDGEIRATGLPAGVPMFEQLVDVKGRPIMTAGGPAHVAGFNYGAAHATVRCVGCHLGHSTLPAGDEPSARDVAWFNASPSAKVTASSVAPGTAGARAAVDRRTRGPVQDVAWIASGNTGESLSLEWSLPLEAREVVLYGPRPNRESGTDAAIERCELRLLHDGRDVGHRMIDHRLSPNGTRVSLGPVVIDGMEVRVVRTRGTVAHRRAAALAEIETIARLEAPKGLPQSRP